MKLGVWKNPSSSLGDCSGNNQEDKACDCFFSPVICDRTSAVKSLLCTFPSGTPRNEILWQPPDLLALLQQPGVKSPKKGPLHHQRHTWSRLFPPAGVGSSDTGPSGLSFVPPRLQTTRAAPPERAGMKTQQILSERDTVTRIGPGVRQRVKIIGCIFHSDRMFYSCRIFIARNIVYQDIN